MLEMSLKTNPFQPQLTPDMGSLSIEDIFGGGNWLGPSLSPKIEGLEHPEKMCPGRSWRIFWSSGGSGVVTFSGISLPKRWG